MFEQEHRPIRRKKSMEAFDPPLTSGRLPSRKERHARRRQARLVSMLGMGAVVFGTVFLGLLGFELYQAAQKSQPAGEVRKQEEASMSRREQPTEVSSSLPSSGGQPQPIQEDKQAESNDSSANQAAPPAGGGASGATTEEQQADNTRQIAANGQDSAKTSASPHPQAPAETSHTPPAQQVAPRQDANAQPQQQKPRVVRHKVQKGDTLFLLSRKYYGNGMGVNRIARYNGLDPNGTLPIGKVLYIPLS